MGVKDVVIKVTADTSQAVRGFQKMNRSVGGQLTKQEKAMAGLRRAAIPATAALVGLGLGAKKAVDAAADMNEALSKNEVLFTTQAKDVAEWSKGMAKGFGISRKAALDAAGTFATFGKSAGLQGKDLSAFSTDLTELASDLASFNNTSPEEAIEALGSALRGEAEPMRKYGVLLDDASLRQEALAQGLIKTTKQALTPQQKVLAAQKLILKQTADAQGDYARTSNSAANRQKALRAQLENVTAELGTALLPAFTMLVGWMQKAATWASKNTTTVKVLIATFGGLAAAIVAANVAMKAYKVATDAAKVAQAALNVAMRLNPIGIVVTALAALAAAVVIAYNKSETFRGMVESVWNWLKTLGGWLTTTGTTVFDGLKGAYEAIQPVVDTFITALKWLWNTGKTALGWYAALGKLYFKGIKSAFEALETPIEAVKSALSWLWNTGKSAINWLAGRFDFGVLSSAANAVATALEKVVAALKWIMRNAASAISWLKKLNPLGGTGRVPDVLRPRSTATLSPSTRSQTVNVVIDGDTRALISEEMVSRALQRMILRSDARNGMSWAL